MEDDVPRRRTVVTASRSRDPDVPPGPLHPCRWCAAPVPWPKWKSNGRSAPRWIPSVQYYQDHPFCSPAHGIAWRRAHGGLKTITAQAIATIETARRTQQDRAFAALDALTACPWCGATALGSPTGYEVHCFECGTTVFPGFEPGGPLTRCRSAPVPPGRPVLAQRSR